MCFEDCPKHCLSSKIMLFDIFNNIMKSKGANLQEF